MGDVIQRKLKRDTAGVIGCILLLFLCSAWILWRYEMLNADVGMVRVDANELVAELECKENWSEGVENAADLAYSLFDLDGTVLATNITRFQAIEKADLHTIGGINNYLVPVFQQGTVKGILYVDVYAGQRSFAWKAWLRNVPVLIIFVVAAFLFMERRRRIIKADIWTPIRELHVVTRNMMEGRVDSKVSYDYDGELGTLCHDFDCMREEILAAYQREIEIKEKERALYASISHDLKTPLASISGYIEELLYDVITDPVEVKSVLKRMLEKAMVLKKLMEDILEHSKAQLHQLSIQREEVYARDYFEALLKGYQQDAEAQKYGFQYNLPENLLISMDPDRIAQVMQNLIDNAVKYGKEDLKIEVEFQLIEKPAKILIICVKDNGSGIDATDLPFIFHMFYRGNKARTQDIPGSGLGLNIAKYIVEEHGGQIECDSIAGAGTTISFSIPVQ